MVASHKRPHQKTNTLDVELLIELVRCYPCIWNVKLNVLKDTLKRKLAWNKIKELLGGNFGGNDFLQSYFLEDTHRKKAPSNKTPALTESTNMGIWIVGTSNQLCIRGS